MCSQPERYDANLDDDDSKIQGFITNPTSAQMYLRRGDFSWGSGSGDWEDAHPPRRIVMKRGNSAVKSQPALIEFAAMFVPSSVVLIKC